MAKWARVSVKNAFYDPEVMVLNPVSQSRLVSFFIG